jgi:hypothetical protein
VIREIQDGFDEENILVGYDIKCPLNILKMWERRAGHYKSLLTNYQSA